jgi:hypothetical protein
MMELLLSLLLWLGVIQPNSQYTSQWLSETATAQATAINQAMADSTLCNSALQAYSSSSSTIVIVDPDKR